MRNRVYGGDTINFVFSLFKWILKRLKQKKQPQQKIEIVNSSITIINIHKD